MIKTFYTNRKGKIEFTKEELEKLLNEVWLDGKNSTFTWTSPYYYYWSTSPTIMCTDTTTTTTSTYPVQIEINGDTTNATRNNK